MPLKVLHERWKCISCAACAAMAPEFWSMETEDGKSHLQGSTARQAPEGPVEERDLGGDEAAGKQNQEAADVCPVQCIHVRRNDTGTPQ